MAINWGPFGQASRVPDVKRDPRLPRAGGRYDMSMYGTDPYVMRKIQGMINEGQTPMMSPAQAQAFENMGKAEAMTKAGVPGYVAETMAGRMDWPAIQMGRWAQDLWNQYIDESKGQLQRTLAPLEAAQERTSNLQDQMQQYAQELLQQAPLDYWSVFRELSSIAKAAARKTINRLEEQAIGNPAAGADLNRQIDAVNRALGEELGRMSVVAQNEVARSKQNVAGGAMQLSQLGGQEQARQDELSKYISGVHERTEIIPPALSGMYGTIAALPAAEETGRAPALAPNVQFLGNTTGWGRPAPYRFGPSGARPQQQTGRNFGPGPSPTPMPQGRGGYAAGNQANLLNPYANIPSFSNRGGPSAPVKQPKPKRSKSLFDYAF
jgi:hypothetical protein